MAAVATITTPVEAADDAYKAAGVAYKKKQSSSNKTLVDDAFQDIKDVERVRYREQTLDDLSQGQLPKSKIGKPAVSSIFYPERRTGIRDYKGLDINKRGLADTEFWYLTEYFADEMELTLKIRQLKNKLSTIPTTMKPYFQEYVDTLEGVGQQAAVQASQTYLQMTDDAHSHNKAFKTAISTGESALSAGTARIRNQFSMAGIQIDQRLAEFEEAVALQKNATTSDANFNSVMDKGRIRDLF
jgi:hypothetical protein